MFAIDFVARHWWVFMVQGVLAVIFGILALAAPNLTGEALILLFAIWVTVDGILALIGSVGAAEAQEPWWPLVFTGILGIGIGVVTFKWPGVTVVALLALIAVWSILRGVMELVAAVRLRREIKGEFWLGLSGVLSILFGALVVAYPASGALAVVWIIGLYAVLFGATLIALGFKLRGFQSQLPSVHAHPHAA